MSIDLDGEPRLILDARLSPIAGSTFQPTGFPDLGAATFQRPGHPQALLVESVQSMTNHLEAAGWDFPARAPAAQLGTLPYVRVESSEDGEFLTSTRLEPHRLAASYVRDAEIAGKRGTDYIAERLALRPGRPLDWPQIYRAIFELDPLCLLHGVFFSDKKWSGNPKVRRAITAVIEAHDVAPVVSGGLKRDDVAVKTTEGRGASEGYGFVPFGRTEWTAGEIVMTLVVDLHQLRGYGLSPEEEELLTLVALWEAATLLENPLRLRTACDLDVDDVTVRRPRAYALPAAAEIAAKIGSMSPPESDGPLLASWPAPDVKKPTEATNGDGAD